MRLSTEFKNKKKKYLIHNTSGYNDIVGIFELRLMSLEFSISTKDGIKNFHVIDIKPFVHAKLKNQGELFLLACVDSEKMNISSYAYKAWEDSDYFKSLVRDGKLSDAINKGLESEPF